MRRVKSFSCGQTMAWFSDPNGKFLFDEIFRSFMKKLLNIYPLQDNFVKRNKAHQ